MTCSPASSARTPPSLGSTVDQVLREFLAEADAWVGIFVVEATLVLSDAGPARKYRAAPPGRSTRIAVSLAGGLCLRDATPAEEAELEEGIRRGFVQIERFRSRSYDSRVLHQATGREIPTSAAEVV